MDHKTSKKFSEQYNNDTKYKRYNHLPPALNFLQMCKNIRKCMNKRKIIQDERHRFGALRDRMLGKFAGKNKTDAGLDFP